ncbi:PadR family transcriptional regulator [Ruminococcus sp. OA3]|uniref:PadR family transcriptional regulator n=1 Tax=Ruminococcus sp. OA3 TaxID=2914164 RepID=UPI001F06C385|nr:PadR family transcriptional regulator [Ruminococcus sp. OA3]MCH1983366.1 PadR family transcriptional regulator [Ruminococcus sp. OA3]
MIFPLNAPMFDLLVLAVVDKEDAYGYQITQIVKRVSNTKDSTLYPILRRLQEDNCLTAYDEQYQGRNRKYYRITENGKAKYQNLLSEWTLYKNEVDKIIEGGSDSEQG